MDFVTLVVANLGGLREYGLEDADLGERLLIWARGSN